MVPRALRSPGSSAAVGAAPTADVAAERMSGSATVSPMLMPSRMVPRALRSPGSSAAVGAARTPTLMAGAVGVQACVSEVMINASRAYSHSSSRSSSSHSSSPIYSHKSGPQSKLVKPARARAPSSSTKANVMVGRSTHSLRMQGARHWTELHTSTPIPSTEGYLPCRRALKLWRGVTVDRRLSLSFAAWALAYQRLGSLCTAFTRWDSRTRAAGRAAQVMLGSIEAPSLQLAAPFAASSPVVSTHSTAHFEPHAHCLLTDAHPKSHVFRMPR